MGVSILEALQNAEANVNDTGRGFTFGLALAKEQIHSAVTLLEKGYGIHDQVEPLLRKYGNIEDVPAAAEQALGGGYAGQA